VEDLQIGKEGKIGEKDNAADAWCAL